MGMMGKVREIGITVATVVEQLAVMGQAPREDLEAPMEPVVGKIVLSQTQRTVMKM